MSRVFGSIFADHDVSVIGEWKITNNIHLEITTVEEEQFWQDEVDVSVFREAAVAELQLPGLVTA